MQLIVAVSKHSDAMQEFASNEEKIASFLHVLGFEQAGTNAARFTSAKPQPQVVKSKQVDRDGGQKVLVRAKDPEQLDSGKQSTSPVLKDQGTMNKLRMRVQSLSEKSNFQQTEIKDLEKKIEDLEKKLEEQKQQQEEAVKAAGVLLPSRPAAFAHAEVVCESLSHSHIHIHNLQWCIEVT
jgi:predicted RNase H-like nuclease (RuvC/YqgF family)